MTCFTKLLSTTALCAALLMPGFVNAQEVTGRTIFGIDSSGSSTFLYEQHSANEAARYVRNYIAGLEAPHALMLLSVGDAGLAQRSIDIRATVTTRRATRAKRLAEQFAGVFRSLPGLVQEGRITPDGTTSLVSFLRSVEPVCASNKTGENTRIILFTDGVEWSTEIDGRAFLNGTAGLPKPDHAFLSGCAVEMHGIGQLRADLSSAGLEERLVPFWRDWLTAAGATSVRVTGSFFTF